MLNEEPPDPAELKEELEAAESDNEEEAEPAEVEDELTEEERIKQTLDEAKADQYLEEEREEEKKIISDKSAKYNAQEMGSYVEGRVFEEKEDDSTVFKCPYSLKQIHKFVSMAAEEYPNKAWAVVKREVVGGLRLRQKIEDLDEGSIVLLERSSVQQLKSMRETTKQGDLAISFRYVAAIYMFAESVARRAKEEKKIIPRGMQFIRMSAALKPSDLQQEVDLAFTLYDTIVFGLNFNLQSAMEIVEQEEKMARLKELKDLKRERIRRRLLDEKAPPLKRCKKPIPVMFGIFKKPDMKLCRKADKAIQKRLNEAMALISSNPVKSKKLKKQAVYMKRQLREEMGLRVDAIRTRRGKW